MSLWNKTTGAPNWAPAVRTKEGWEHAETGELLVAFADTSYVETSAGSTIKEMYLGTYGNKKLHYKVGDKIQLRVVFTERVKVTGVPVIYMTFGTAKRALQYVDTGSRDVGALLFEYVLTADDVAAATEVSLGTTATAATVTLGTGASSLTITARTAGVDGNSITVALVDPGANDQSLSVAVVGTDITVNLATGADGAITSTAALVKAALEAEVAFTTLCEEVGVVSSGTGVVEACEATPLAGGAAAGSGVAITLPTDVTIQDVTAKQATKTFGTSNSTIVFTAKQAGTVGNAIDITLADPGTENASLGVAVAAGDEITVNLATNAAVKASKSIGTLEAGFVVQAKTAGTAGNSITIEFLDPGAENATADITVTDTAISVTLAASAVPAITTTVDDLKALIEATPAADALIAIIPRATPGSATVPATAQVALTGGSARAVTSTVNQVKAAVEANADASELVTVTTGAGNGTGVVAAAVKTALTNGGDAVNATLTYGDAAVVLTDVTVS